MKIQNDGLPGSASLDTARTQPAPQATSGSASSGLTISAHDGDSVQISGISTHVAEANAADGQQRANRVAELAALNSRGSYEVNATALSRALVSQAVQAASGGKV